MADVNTDRLMRDLQDIVANTEQLLRATADHTGEKVSQVRAHAEHSLRTARNHLHDAEQRVLDRARIAARRTDRYVHANPWSAMGVVAGIAFAIGCPGCPALKCSVPASDATDVLIRTVRSTVTDLRQQDVDRLQITLDSALDEDLGLDSLARVELFMRVEREFGVRLPESLFGTAETVRDILDALSAGAASAPRLQTAPAIETAIRNRSTIAPPSHVQTLSDVLAWHVDHHADVVQLTVCRDGADERITYAQLWQHARLIAGGLQQHGVRMGDTIALMLPTSTDYFYAFFGVLLAGGIPVPLYPPARLSQIEEHVRRHAGILENAGAAVLITVPEMVRLAGMLRMHSPTLRKITTVDQLTAAQATPVPVSPAPDAIALLQYTSGSTGQPKGVTLSHANLLANILALGAAGKVERTDVFVSWLPLYHDMGLIGAWLCMLYFGLPLVVMSPLSFLTRPARWLQAIHRYGGTLSAAPNFAYELCLKRIADEDLVGVNLASWRLALNGAEAVMPETITRFQERFARWGFRPTALTPVYGLAESSLGLTFPPLGRGPLIDVIEREPFMRTGTCVPASPDVANPLRFVSCGVPLREHRVRVVDEDGRELGERREGRLEFQGPSATRGYFRNPQADERLLRGDWLDSGDRAYIAAGEVYLTGRIKDIIIRAGRHIYPDELETAIGALSDVRKGCVAVFGSADPATGTERVVVLAETYVEDAARREAIRKQIIQCVMTLIGEPPDEVVLAAPHTVLKTSSGKIRRAASRRALRIAAVSPGTATPRLGTTAAPVSERDRTRVAACPAAPSGALLRGLLLDAARTAGHSDLLAGSVATAGDNEMVDCASIRAGFHPSRGHSFHGRRQRPLAFHGAARRSRQSFELPRRSVPACAAAAFVPLCREAGTRAHAVGSYVPAPAEYRVRRKIRRARERGRCRAFG